MPVSEQLSLDIRQALASVDQLDRQLTATTAKFQTGLAQATRQLDVKVDSSQAVTAEKNVESLNRALEEEKKKQDEAAAAAKRHNDDLEKVGRTALVAGAGLTAAFGFAAAAALNFDREMSVVAAVSGATGNELERLRDSAIQAGQATIFSASQAAQAQGELARAGLSTADILSGALTGALNLAAAGQLDLATAATITATSLNIFGLEGADASRVADVLAAGANKSAAGVLDLGEGLTTVGPIAKQLGVSLEDTVGALALLADRGIKGAEAGTQLNRVLLNLSGPTDVARTVMKDLGLATSDTTSKFFDANGEFVGFAATAGLLQDALSGLSAEQRSAALNTLFGTFGIRAANQLYEAGTAVVNDYSKAVNDQGAAQRFASVQLNNLSGDLEQLSGSIETALITGGSQATDVLRFMAQTATGVVNQISALPGPLQAVGIGLAGIGGTGLLAVAVIGTMIPKFREFKIALDGVTAGMPRLQALIGTLGKFGTAAAVMAAAAFAGITLAEALGQSAKGLQLNLDIIQGLNAGGFDRFARTVIDADKKLGGASATLQIFNKLLQDSPSSAQQFVDALGRQGVATDRYQEKIDKRIKSDARAQDAQTAYAGAVDAATGAVDDLAAATEEAVDVNKEYVDTLDNLFGRFADSQQAFNDFIGGLAELTETLVKNGNTLDVNTEAGRANRDALIDITEKAQDHAGAVLRETGSVDAANKVLADNVVALTDTAIAAGLSEEAALDYTAALFGIPPERRTEIKNSADLARVATELLLAKYKEVPPVVETFVVLSGVEVTLAQLREVQRQMEILTATGGSFGLFRGGVARGGQVAPFTPRMAGGPTFPDGSFLVGEQGFELFRPTTPGMIVPHPQSAGLTSGGNTFSFNVQVLGPMSPIQARATGEEVVAGAEAALARRGVHISARVSGGG